jgi:hypothetical protein
MYLGRGFGIEGFLANLTCPEFIFLQNKEKPFQLLNQEKLFNVFILCQSNIGI